MSKWSDWNEQKKIEANNRCSTCGILINWRRIPTGMCRKCSQKHAKGELASNWKGGRKINTGGYVEIYCPEPHHRRKKVGHSYYVLEHILIWEQTHGKPLPKGYVIHHMNGIKTDNRPENLVAVRVKNHGKWTYVRALQSRIRELEQLRLLI